MKMLGRSERGPKVLRIVQHMLGHGPELFLSPSSRRSRQFIEQLDRRFLPDRALPDAVHRQVRRNPEQIPTQESNGARLMQLQKAHLKRTAVTPRYQPHEHKTHETANPARPNRRRIDIVQTVRPEGRRSNRTIVNYPNCCQFARSRWPEAMSDLLLYSDSYVHAEFICIVADELCEGRAVVAPCLAKHIAVFSLLNYPRRVFIQQPALSDLFGGY